MSRTVTPEPPEISRVAVAPAPDPAYSRVENAGTELVHSLDTNPGGWVLALINVVLDADDKVEGSYSWRATYWNNFLSFMWYDWGVGGTDWSHAEEINFWLKVRSTDTDFLTLTQGITLIVYTQEDLSGFRGWYIGRNRGAVLGEWSLIRTNMLRDLPDLSSGVFDLSIVKRLHLTLNVNQVPQDYCHLDYFFLSWGGRRDRLILPSVESRVLRPSVPSRVVAPEAE